MRTFLKRYLGRVRAAGRPQKGRLSKPTAHTLGGIEMRQRAALKAGRLARFSHRPESRVRFSPAGFALSGRGIQLCPIDAPWIPEHLAAAAAACSQALLHPNRHCDPTSPWQPEYLTASVSSLRASRFDEKERSLSNRMLGNKRVQCYATIALPGATPL